MAELSQRNKQTLIDAVVHAVNEDYKGMADDFVQLVGFHCQIIVLPGLHLFPVSMAERASQNNWLYGRTVYTQLCIIAWVVHLKSKFIND